MVIIRKARATDCDDITQVHTASVRAISPGFYTAEEIESLATPKQRHDYEQAMLSKEFFVAEDGVVVGFGVLEPRTGLVEAVFVSPAAGGRGVGLQILARLEERARAIRLQSLTLNSSLNAAGFYERAGYVPNGKGRYRLQTGIEIECVPMVKNLS